MKTLTARHEKNLRINWKVFVLKKWTQQQLIGSSLLDGAPCRPNKGMSGILWKSFFYLVKEEMKWNEAARKTIIEARLDRSTGKTYKRCAPT